MNYKKVALTTAKGITLGIILALWFVVLFGYGTAVTVLTPMALAAVFSGLLFLLIN